jgi:hypothetical protein
LRWEFAYVIFTVNSATTALYSMADDSMADDAPRILICLIEGQSSIFRVELTGNMDVSQLKELVKKAREMILSRVEHDDIILWKVRMTKTSDNVTDPPAD